MWKLITAEPTLQPYLLQRSSRPCSYRQPEHSELTATAALNQLGSFANHLTSVQTMILYHIIAEHHAEHRLVVINRTYYADHVLRQSLTNLEYQILGSCWLHWQYGCNNFHTIDFFCILYKLILGTLYSLSLELLNILLQGIVLVDVLSDDTFEILGVVEQTLQATMVSCKP